MNLTLKDVQARQASYDKKYWQFVPGLPTTAHSGRRISKLAGIIATVAEAIDLKEPPDFLKLDLVAIPELLIFAARLANDRELDLGTAYIKSTLGSRLASSSMEIDLKIKDVQNSQAAYEPEYLSTNPGAQTIAYCERQVSILAGKIAVVGEVYDRGLKPDLRQLDSVVIPDLLVMSARLANAREANLSELYLRRSFELQLSC